MPARSRSSRPDDEAQAALPPDTSADAPDGAAGGAVDGAAESFEAVFTRLEEISAALEAGGLPLERSVDLYEEGMRLAERCQQLLASVEQRIETLRQRTLDGEDERA